jgi:hypothetical protein
MSLHRSRLTASSHHFLLSSLLLLLLSKRLCLRLDQSILDLFGEIVRKARSLVVRAWYRKLPSLQHFVELFPGLRIYEAVSSHEGVVKLEAEEQGVWTSNVFRYRVQ